MACSEPVINLQSSRGVRFSVVAGGTPSIISINTAPKSARKVVKCRCTGRKAARTVDFLQLTHTDDLCKHLAMLRVFLQLLSLEGDDSGSEVDELSDGEMSDAEIMDSCRLLDELGRPQMNMNVIKSEISSSSEIQQQIDMIQPDISSNKIVSQIELNGISQQVIINAMEPQIDMNDIQSEDLIIDIAPVQ